jgi:WD40 repeat protein
MDLNELYQDLHDKNFTDIELILTDPHESITIHAHKIILACSSKYFKKLFTIGNGKNKPTIEVHVRNCMIAHDIILTFYKKNEDTSIELTSYPKWKYILETTMCRDFFSLHIDISLLYDLNVPSEGFDLLIETVALFDFVNDYELMQTIKNNFPDDYELNKLSIDFIKEIIEVSNRKFISGSKDKTIKIWDAYSGKLLKTLEVESSVATVAFSHDNLKIVSGCYGKHIYMWDATTGCLLKKFSNGYQLPVFSVSFSSDSLKILSGDDSHNKINIWDVEADLIASGKILNTLNKHTNAVFSASFSSNDQKIVSGSCDYSIKIWDTSTGNVLHTLYGHTNFVNSVSFSHDNLKIVSGSSDCNIKLWDPESGQLLNTLTGHKYSVNSVLFSYDNKKILSGSRDKLIKIWDAQTGTLLNTLRGHESQIYSVSFSADNKKIVSGSNDCSIKIWDAQTGALLNTLNGHYGSVHSVAFSKPYQSALDKKLIDYLNSIDQILV